MKVRLILAIAVLALLAGAAALGLRAAYRSRITSENYERIQEGMTKQQVEAILGGPPRWEVQAKRPRDEIIHHIDGGGRRFYAEWWGREGVITVFYDRNGVVSDKSFEELPFEAKTRSLWDYLLFRAALRIEPAQLIEGKAASYFSLS